MSYKELSQDIKNSTLKSLYLIYGDEQCLCDYSLKQLHDKFVNPQFEEFNFIEIDFDIENASSMFNAFETLPLFEDKKIIIIKNAPFFKATGNPLSDEEMERLNKYIESPYNTNCVFFITNNSLDKRKKITKNIQKNGVLVDMQKLNQSEFEKWINKRIKGNMKEISSSNLRYLVEMSGYLEKNSEKKLYDIDNDLNKLLSSIGEKSNIERNDIDKVIERPVENNIFLMVDATAEKNGKVAFQVLNQLLLSGEAEIKILFMITRHFKILNRVKTMLEAGYTTMAIAPEISLPQFIVKKYVNQATKFTLKQIHYILKSCTEYDRRIKTGKMTSEIAIEVLITKITLCK